MNITLRQLHFFESVARLQSYSLAAQELHRTQPAISMQVRQLEEEVGLTLFDRAGRGVQLSEAGQEMYRCCRAVREQLQQTENTFQALKGISGGRLRIAVATTANHFAMRMLAAFSKRHPGTSFALDVTNRQTLLEHLTGNVMDIVIMGKPPGSKSEVNSVAFMDNPLVVVAPANHPLARYHGTIPLSRIEDEAFVLREPASGTRQAMQRFFDKRGLPLHASMEMTSNEAIKQAVEAGLGLAVASMHTLELELSSQRLVVLDVEGFPILRHWYLVTCKGRRLSPITEAFQTFVLEEYHNFLVKPDTGHSAI